MCVFVYVHLCMLVSMKSEAGSSTVDPGTQTQLLGLCNSTFLH